MQKNFFFLGGLPRSGSTVLASLLSQNPAVYASPNSPLVNMLVNVNKHLQDTEQAKAFLQPTQRIDVLRHIMTGFYAFADHSVVIDKSRSWPHPHNLALLTELLEQPVKIIATVRDLPSVLASFIRIIHEQPETVSFVDQALRDQRQLCTDINRAQLLFSPQGTVYEAWYTLKQAFTEGWGPHIHLVEYDDLVNNPERTLAYLYEFLGLPAFTHDLTNIINHTPENDLVYHMPTLHHVRPRLQKTAPSPRLVLGDALFMQYMSVPHFWRQVNTHHNPLQLHTLSATWQ